MLLHPAAALALSYISGSVPAAYIAGKWKGVDLRKQGSGNLGATNVFRVLGAKIGLAVFAFDTAKGALPVLLLPQRTAWDGAPVWLAIACGIAAIMGHVRPVFLKFGRGGKGVATAGGVFLALAPLPTLASITAFVIIVFASGYVSLGSLVAASVLPVVLALQLGPTAPLTGLSVAVALFVFYTHRANIGRLRRGEEHRFGKKAAS
ncbi:MAG: Glycerol-3-phosphate acyltransferase [Gemmatimonadetes bacterium]|nr:Glycerol-3-phosphate acyltransferase [Gemmatimonadota bacterium]